MFSSYVILMTHYRMTDPKQCVHEGQCEIRKMSTETHEILKSEVDYAALSS